MPPGQTGGTSASGPLTIHTIGFTRHSAEDFFETLRSVGTTRLVDVRLHNSSQLAGFAKRADLTYFLDRLCGAEYVHEPRLAPTEELLARYRKEGRDWPAYEAGFLALLAARAVEQVLPPALFDGVTVLLCSELSAEHCHRRLVVEHLATHWGGVETRHL